MSDDGIGVHAVRELKRRARAGVLVTEIGTSMFDAVPLLAWADRVIVIDALQAGGPPGAIYWAPIMSIRSSCNQTSLHELDLTAMLRFLPQHCQLPEIHVLGVEPASLELGLSLSPQLMSTLPRIGEFVNDKLKQWREELSIRNHRAKRGVVTSK